jgi:hypothetical protein
MTGFRQNASERSPGPATFVMRGRVQLRRGMNRYFDHGQHLHSSREACRLHCRAWALWWNFAPSRPETVRESPGLRSPAERLNGERYHPEWLQNLLVSASLGG